MKPSELRRRIGLARRKREEADAELRKLMGEVARTAPSGRQAAGDEALTISEAARLAGVSRVTAGKWAKAQKSGQPDGKQPRL